MECYHCRLGHFQPAPQPYLSPFGDTMLVVPQAPALRCDMCGYVHFDERFLEYLQYLLDRLGETETDAPPHAWTPDSDPGEAWQSGRRIS